MPAHRREFLRHSLAASSLVTLGESTVPSFLRRSALAAADSRASSSARILIVVQLIGGNDGLNTVVPHRMDGYLKGRRALRLPTGQIHNLTKDIGLHPSMGQMARLVEDGRLAIIQGVGYPNPDRSHFRSMDIWESARMDLGAPETGWLGRLLDTRKELSANDIPALHVGNRALPVGLRARSTEVPSLQSLEQYTLRLGGSSTDRDTRRDAIDAAARLERKREDPLLGFVQRSTLAAYASSRKLEEVAKQESGEKAGSYPAFGLAQRLKVVAQIIKAGFGTRIFYTSLDGFDTHANQLGAHSALLGELSDSLTAFHSDLKSSGDADRVAVLVFSEFGRRVAENASNGTDHGAAAPVFVLGPVQSQARGLVGAHPSLEDLDDGDLKHHTDFRRVYAAILEDWLDCPAESIVGKGHTPLPLFKKS